MAPEGLISAQRLQNLQKMQAEETSVHRGKARSGDRRLEGLDAGATELETVKSPSPEHLRANGGFEKIVCQTTTKEKMA